MQIVIRKMKLFFRIIIFVFTYLNLVSSMVMASEDSSDEYAIKIHGFGSQGYIYTTSNNLFSLSSKHGSFDLTEVGLNFTKKLSDHLSTGIQLFTRRLGSNGDFDAKIDWFYLNYRFLSNYGIRVGRTKIPFGLYNEINDTDSARANVLMPQSIYPAANRNFLLAQDGVELYGYQNLNDFGALELRLYLGTIFIDTINVNSTATLFSNINVPYLYGGRLMWETPVAGLQAGVSLQSIRLEYNMTSSSGVQSYVNLPALLWVASVEYNHDSLLLAAEYSKWNQERSTISPISLDVTAISERMYALAAYRFTEWFQPEIYYSIYYPNTSTDRSLTQNHNRDLTLALRFDLTQNWILKAEGHYINGTASLSSTLNNGQAISTLQPNWGAFLLRATGYF